MKRILFIVGILFLTGCSNTITFNSNGGSSIEPLKVKSDEILGELPSPVLEGFTFEGWYLDENFTNKFNVESFDKSVELYAKWDINKYSFTIKFGDEVIQELTYEYNQNLDPINNFERIGYEFDGWYIDHNFNSTYTFENMPARDLTIFAKMIPNSHVITFITNGGSEIEPINFEFGANLKTVGKVSKLTDATFKGWYLDSKLTIPADGQTMPDNDVTLYAKWKTYKIVQDNISKAKQILSSYGCTIDNNNPQRCMELSINGLSVDSEILLDRWNTRTTVFSIGHMYVGHAVWYSYEGEKLTIRYTINNKPAPESEVQDVVDRIPGAIMKLEQIEESFKNAGLLTMDDLEWSN